MITIGLDNGLVPYGKQAMVDMNGEEMFLWYVIV